MRTPRYLTKSRFKLGCECPAKLFYTGKREYADQKIADPFLLELAKGGFQVGELAKCYFPDGTEVKADHGDYEEALRQTNELLAKGDVTIFEAAVEYHNFYILVDVFIKHGNRIEVIEVKSKSYADGDSFFGRDAISTIWKPYLYDIAFQKHVVQQAFPGYEISAFLMMTDKDSLCPTNGLNQKFRVKTATNGQKYVEVASPLTAEELDPAGWILRKVCVDEACDRIFAGTDMKVAAGNSFADRAIEFSDHYSRDEKMTTPISGDCKKCEFRALPAESAEGKLDGFKECWTNALGWRDADFSAPTILEIWDNRSKDKMISAGKIKLADLVESDIGPKTDGKPGICRTERQWLQVEKAASNDLQYFIDADGLRAEMKKWKYPFHFIDFEAATPAIPFTKGRRPYERIVFQFSHHTVDADGNIRHAGQYLNDEIGVFPNYDFLRALRDDLSTDDGTIFQYHPYENTCLIMILRQLMSDEADIPDRDNLVAFIKSITKSPVKSDEKWEGPRSMVDLREMVLRFYYDPRTRGSNSIKDVLPAMLNSSQYLKDKYSTPFYGKEIPSFNFLEGKVWVEFEEDGTVKDPYGLLPKIFGQEIIDRMSDDDELRDGGTAMMAYARLQFEDMSTQERTDIKNALLRYCELDSFAMAMVYEGWREMIR